MKCPNCAVAVAAGAIECAACGVIFAKFKTKEAPSFDGDARLPVVDPMKARLVAGGILLLWLAAFGLYCRHAVDAARKKSAREAAPEPPTVTVRDPETGELRRIPVVKAAPRKAESGDAAGR